MLFGFELRLTDGGTEFGVVSAKDKNEAYAIMSQESLVEDVIGYEIVDLEELLDSQYCGLAYLNSGR